MALAPTTFKQLTKQQVFPNVCCNIGAFSGPVADKSLHGGLWLNRLPWCHYRWPAGIGQWEMQRAYDSNNCKPLELRGAGAASVFDLLCWLGCYCDVLGFLVLPVRPDSLAFFFCSSSFFSSCWKYIESPNKCHSHFPPPPSLQIFAACFALFFLNLFTGFKKSVFFFGMSPIYAVAFRTEAKKNHAWYLFFLLAFVQLHLEERSSLANLVYTATRG